MTMRCLIVMDSFTDFFSLQQLACQLQAFFLMEMAEPGEPKRVKTPFCCENGSRDGTEVGERPPKVYVST